MMTAYKEYKGITYFSQPEFRTITQRVCMDLNEDELKYNYDRYTWLKKVPPIRKKLERKKVAELAKYKKIDLSRIVLEEWA